MEFGSRGEEAREGGKCSCPGERRKGECRGELRCGIGDCLPQEKVAGAERGPDTGEGEGRTESGEGNIESGDWMGEGMMLMGEEREAEVEVTRCSASFRLRRPLK